MEPLYIIACTVVWEEMQSHVPAGTPALVLEFGLHNSPEKLRQRLQEEIDKVPPGYTIVLGYGLCGAQMELDLAHHDVVIQFHFGTAFGTFAQHGSFSFPC